MTSALIFVSWPIYVLGSIAVSHPKSPRICVQYGWKAISTVQLKRKHPFAVPTPARTLVMSNTLKPFNGRVASSSAATLAKVLRREAYVVDRGELEDAIEREALTRDRVPIEAMLKFVDKVWRVGGAREWGVVVAPLL